MKNRNTAKEGYDMSDANGKPDTIVDFLRDKWYYNIIGIILMFFIVLSTTQELYVFGMPNYVFLCLFFILTMLPYYILVKIFPGCMEKIEQEIEEEMHEMREK